VHEPNPDPIACTLSQADLSTQAERWRRLIARAAIARHNTPAGIRIEFRAGAGVAEELEQLIATERECCSWAAWSVDAAADPVVLEVTSTGDGVAALRPMLREGLRRAGHEFTLKGTLASPFG
jgi:hypothetical protein